MTEEIKEIIDDLGNKDSYVNDITMLTFDEGKMIKDYITNLQQENEKLKYNARGQVNDYFKDKYADEVLKKADLIKDFELTCYKNYELKQENEKLKEEIDILKSNFEVEIDDCENYKKWYRDYKSRCEKAIEYIKNLSNEPNVFGHYGIDTECKKWLLNILNGSDEK